MLPTSNPARKSIERAAAALVGERAPPAARAPRAPRAPQELLSVHAEVLS